MRHAEMGDRSEALLVTLEKENRDNKIAQKAESSQQRVTNNYVSLIFRNKS